MIGKTNVGGGKKSGQYVWKRQILKGALVENTDFTELYIIKDDSTGTLHFYYADSFDFVDVGFSLVNPQLAEFSAASEAQTFSPELQGKYLIGVKDSPSTSRINASYESSGEFLIKIGDSATFGRGGGFISSRDVNVYSATKEVLSTDFVVSDDPTAYPDGAEQDGYWYEKAAKVTGIDFGEITLASTAESVTVSHNLGTVPSWVALFPKEFAIVSGNTSANINGNAAYSGSSTSMRVASKANTLTETEITFAAYSSSYPFTETGYYWIAIA